MEYILEYLMDKINGILLLYAPLLCSVTPQICLLQVLKLYGAQYLLNPPQSHNLFSLSVLSLQTFLSSQHS